MFHRLGFLLAFFQMTGLDYRRFRVYSLPGGGLFFVLFHPFHLAYSISGAGEIIQKGSRGKELPEGFCHPVQAARGKGTFQPRFLQKCQKIGLLGVQIHLEQR